jgi:hypothetical protein
MLLAREVAMMCRSIERPAPLPRIVWALCIDLISPGRDESRFRAPISKSTSSFQIVHMLMLVIAAR